MNFYKNMALHSTSFSDLFVESGSVSNGPSKPPLLHPPSPSLPNPIKVGLDSKYPVRFYQQNTLVPSNLPPTNDLNEGVSKFRHINKNIYKWVFSFSNNWIRSHHCDRSYKIPKRIGAQENKKGIFFFFLKKTSSAREKHNCSLPYLIRIDTQQEKFSKKKNPKFQPYIP